MAKYEQLETFNLVVQVGSFAAAATKLGISAAAVGKQITLLEKRLGAQLFVRTTRQLHLTAAGKVFYQEVKQVIDKMQMAESVINHLNSEPNGTLTITSSIQFGQEFLVPNLIEFMQLYPKVSIELELADRLPDFTQETIDISFGLVNLSLATLVQRRLFTTRYKLCASPAYIQRIGLPKKSEDLVWYDYIASLNRPDNDILTFKRDKQLKVNAKLKLNDSQTILNFVLMGTGFAKFQDYTVREHLLSGKLVELLPEYAEQTHQAIYLYYPHTNYLNPKIRAFVDFILTKLKLD